LIYYIPRKSYEESLKNILCVCVCLLYIRLIIKNTTSDIYFYFSRIANYSRWWLSCGICSSALW